MQTEHACHLVPRLDHPITQFIQIENVDMKDSGDLGVLPERTDTNSKNSVLNKRKSLTRGDKLVKKHAGHPGERNLLALWLSSLSRPRGSFFDTGDPVEEGVVAGTCLGCGPLWA